MPVSAVIVKQLLDRHMGNFPLTLQYRPRTGQIQLFMLSACGYMMYDGRRRKPEEQFSHCAPWAKQMFGDEIRQKLAQASQLEVFRFGDAMQRLQWTDFKMPKAPKKGEGPNEGVEIPSLENVVIWYDAREVPPGKPFDYIFDERAQQDVDPEEAARQIHALDLLSKTGQYSVRACIQKRLFVYVCSDLGAIYLSVRMCAIYRLQRAGKMHVLAEHQAKAVNEAVAQGRMKPLLTRKTKIDFAGIDEALTKEGWDVLTAPKEGEDTANDEEAKQMTEKEFEEAQVPLIDGPAFPDSKTLMKMVREPAPAFSPGFKTLTALMEGVPEGSPFSACLQATQRNDPHSINADQYTKLVRIQQNKKKTHRMQHGTPTETMHKSCTHQENMQSKSTGNHADTHTSAHTPFHLVPYRLQCPYEQEKQIRSRRQPRVPVTQISLVTHISIQTTGRDVIQGSTTRRHMINPNTATEMIRLAARNGIPCRYRWEMRKILNHGIQPL